MTENEGSERDIDVVIRQVIQKMPEVEVEQLKVKWPADDDNLWWFSLPAVKMNIQIERAWCPFLIETDEQSSKQALKATTVDEAVGMILTYLQSVQAGCPVRLTKALWW